MAFGIDRRVRRTSVGRWRGGRLGAAAGAPPAASVAGLVGSGPYAELEALAVSPRRSASTPIAAIAATARADVLPD